MAVGEVDQTASIGARQVARTRELPPIAFGIERIGLISLRFPYVAMFVLIALAIAAAFGVERLKVDDSLSQLFRTDTPEFKQYEEVTRRFPSSEYDVLVVVEGKTLLERNSIEKLRDLVTDVQLIDGTRGLVSLFSARQPPEQGKLPAPLFPEELPQGAEYDQLIQRVLSNEIIRGKLLSEDGTLALIVLALDPAIVQTNKLSETVGEIRKTVAEDLAGTQLKGELSGVPVMQLEIRNAVERDRVVYNAVGFIAGCAIAIAFFRRVSFMIVAAAPPLIAILLALGTLGWLDFRLNMFLNVMTPLIMVISFADSMQLTFATRHRLLAGESKFEALRNAILVVGPACVLTHGTAGLSFVALLFSDSDLIRTFGEAGLIATIIALAAVLTLVPVLSVLLVQRKAMGLLLVLLAAVGIELHHVIAWLLGTDGAWLELSPHGPVNAPEWGLAIVATLGLVAGALFLIPTTRPLVAGFFADEEAAFVAKVKGADFAVDLLTRFCAWIAARMVRHAGLYSLIAVAVVAGLGFIYANLQPRYRLADQVPDKQQAVQASSRLDAKLTGANPIDVLIEFPKGKSLYDPDTLATIAAVHAAVEKQAGVGNVWSLETLRRWLAEKAGKSDAATLKQYVDVLPEHLVRRFISAEQDSVVVSGRIPDVDASQLLPVVDQLDKTLGTVRAQHPGYQISVTGLAAIAARNSAIMIGKLNRGLTIEFIFVAVFIGIAFRSFTVMLMCFLPGIFPILLSGTLLWLLGQGLQFASIVALTVSFGLGLSATIHFLNRQRLEDNPEDDPAVAVERATVLVGPALILTSVVLACGLAVTVFSDLPSLRLFGWLSAFAMLAALTADMLILRPTAMFLRRISRRMRGQPVGGRTAL